MADKRPSDWWNTIDFRPAPPGWRAIYLHPGEREVVPIAGWLIQERYTQHGQSPPRLVDTLNEDEQVFGRQRRVIPGFVSIDGDWTVRPIDMYDNGTDVWYVLAPGDPEPDASEERQARVSEARWRNGGSGT